jgi:hypothetical protein
MLNFKNTQTYASSSLPCGGAFRLGIMSSSSMKSLPTISEASLAKGIWFVFQTPNAVIRAWGSGSSGLERIYVDETVVSERRSISQDSRHSITVGDEPFNVRFRTISALKGELECSLCREDGQVVQSFVCKYVSSQKYSKTMMVGAVVFGMLFGLIILIFRLSWWVQVIVFLLGFLAWILIRNRNTPFVIEDTTPA